MRRFWAVLTLLLVWVGLAWAYSGKCGIWAEKRGDFTSKNFAGTQAGFDAAKAYCGVTSSVIQINGGCEFINVGSLPDSMVVLWEKSGRWTVYGKGFTFYDRSLNARMVSDSTGTVMIGKVSADSLVARIGASLAGFTGGGGPSQIPAYIVVDSVRTQYGLTVGNGTFIRKHVSALASLSFGKINPGHYEDQVATVCGARDGDAVYLGSPNGSVGTGGVFFAWVSSDDAVTVRSVATSDTLNAATGTFRVDCWMH